MKFAPKTITLRDGARLTLRSATTDDAEAMLRFRREVLAHCPYVLTVPEDLADLTVDEQATRLAALEADARSILLLAFDGGDLIGASSLIGHERTKLRHNADFGASIAEPWRARGLGRILLETLVDLARANPEILRLTLDVMTDNTRAWRMYERAGFRECGRDRRAYRQPDGTLADGIKMDMWVG